MFGSILSKSRVVVIISLILLLLVFYINRFEYDHLSNYNTDSEVKINGNGNILT